jgi:hypothetical protein
VTGLSVVGLIGGHRAARGPWCSGWTSLRLQVVPAPEIPGSASNAKGAPRKYQDWAIFLRGDALRGGDGDF